MRFFVFLIAATLVAQVPLVVGAGNGSGSVTSAIIAGTANQITVSGTCTITTTGTCTLSVPSGFVLPGTINGLTLTTSTGTITLVNAKVLTVNKSLTLDGTDGVTLTFPATNATIARTDAAQTFTGVQTFTAPILGTPTVLNLTNATGLPAAQVPAVSLPTPGATCTFAANSTICVATTTATITVPVPVAGYQFCALNDDNVSTVITLSAIGTSARYENQARSAYGTAGTGTLVSGGAVGDMVCIVGRDSTHYFTMTSNGTWTAN